jgi:hypothetical protein
LLRPDAEQSDIASRADGNEGHTKRIVFGPLIQEVLYPLLHRVRIYPTPRTRITIGFAFISLSMMYATIVQALIYKSLPCHTQPGICGPNQINVWIQAPVYLLMSIGEIFAFVTALEYANENSPKTLEVVVQAVGLLMGGVGLDSSGTRSEPDCLLRLADRFHGYHSRHLLAALPRSD